MPLQCGASCKAARCLSAVPHNALYKTKSTFPCASGTTRADEGYLGGSVGGSGGCKHESSVQATDSSLHLGRSIPGWHCPEDAVYATASGRFSPSAPFCAGPWTPL